MIGRTDASIAGSSRRGRALLIAASAALAAFVLAPAALGATKYVPVAQFPPAYPANQTWTPVSFNSMYAESVAVNPQNHHIYVADSGRSAVYDFESISDSTPDRWNGTTTPSGSFGGEHVAIAIDHTTGDVYVSDRHDAVIDKFDEDGNLIASFGDTSPTPNGQLAGLDTPAGSFSPANTAFSPFGIAVNQVTHDLYAIDGCHNVIDIFDEDGTYVRQITATPEGLYREGGDYAVAIAVNSVTGSVYVGDWAGPNLLFEFDSAGNYVKTWDGSNTPDGRFSGSCTGCSLITAAVEESTGRVFVGSMENRAINIFDSAGNFLSPQIVRSDYAGSTELPYALGYIGGIEIDQETGYLYVANGVEGHIEIYRPVIVPDVAIGPPSDVKTTEATLTGHVDPAGGTDISTCRFEYISDFAYRANSFETPWEGAAQKSCETSPPSGLPYNAAHDVTADITGLTPGTPYHVRIVAANSEGQNRAVAAVFATEGEFSFASAVGSSGAGDGQLNGPQDVAVDNSTGAIYVADTENHRVVKYDADGNFLAAWGWGVDDGSPASQVCTSGCQAGLAGHGAGQFVAPRYIEVDNSPGASAHSVYVADTDNDVVQKFSPTGSLISGWGTGGGMDFSIAGPIFGMTVNNSGDLFVVTYADPYYWTRVGQDGKSTSKQETGGFWGLGVPNGAGIDVDAFGGYYETQESNGVFFKNPTQQMYEGHSIYPNVYGGLPTTGLALDRSTGDTYVGQKTYIDQFATAVPVGCSTGGGGIVGTSNCGPEDVFGIGDLTEASGMGFDPSRSRLYAADPGADRIAVFVRAPVPTVRTDQAIDINATSATLVGHVDPAPAGNVISCHFEYGTDTAYDGGTVPCSPGGTISSSADVMANVGGLSPLASYHYRLIAAGDNGLPRYGQDRTFTASDGIAPSVIDTSSSAVESTSATLEAEINPNNAPTVYRFQYGTSPAYGSQTPSSESIGDDGTGHAVSTAITGLEPGTSYHFRVVAVSFNGVTNGPDQTLNTPGPPTIVESGASAVTESTATLSARIKPGSRPTTFQFEYGTTSAYGSVAGGSAGAGSEAHAVSSAISGLQPGTTYHFRVMASNSVGNAFGGDGTFMTRKPDVVVLPTPACKKGFVRRKGRCVKRQKKKPKHARKHRGSGHG